jgi:hypothetical protein
MASVPTRWKMTRMGLGRHARAIRIGRDLWQSPPLSETTEDRIVEDEFSSIPAAELLKKAVAKIKKADAARPQPFTGQTLPFSHLSVINYGKRIDEWFRHIAVMPKPPKCETYGNNTRNQSKSAAGISALQRRLRHTLHGRGGRTFTWVYTGASRYG